MSITRNKSVRLVALDLDGTLLKADQTIGERTKKALKDAMNSGVHIVIATGRPVSALPVVIRGIEGIEYAITSNGARTIRLEGDSLVSSCCIKPDEVRKLIDMFRRLPYLVEVFVAGKAYIDATNLDDPERHGITGKSVEYIKETRIRIDNLFEFALEHVNEIENINLHFGDMDAKKKLWDELKENDNLTVTSSFNRLLEIGSGNASKASAILALADILGVDHDDIMACGDSLNDIAMLEAAAVAVAMGNSKDEVLAIADYIAPDNENDGVGVAVEKFALLR